ncbi:MAG: TSUP family transporter, partial [Desulfovibrionaceae bacterium]|nr:TSUP family transporter [Desulfovibrionaceae bacterium]
GTVAGLTGAGGPLLAIAWMVACAIHPLTAVGLSMPYSLATAVAASISNAFNHTLNYPLLWRIATLEGLAFLVGVFSVRLLPLLWIRRLMAITCTLLGLFLLFRCLFVSL